MKAFKCILILAVVMMIGISAQAERVVFDPAEENEWYYHGVFYGRGLQLVTDEAREYKGNLYATSEYYHYPGQWGRDHFPIFESSDGGETWVHISDIYETEFQKLKWKKNEDGTYYEVPEGSEGAERYLGDWWTLVYEPQLFELPEDLGELKKGTVICGGISKGENNCALVIYYSTDHLRSWDYLATVALGGKEATGIGSALWEPFFVYENNALYCFFSDERGMTAGGGQRLVYSKSIDGKVWGEVVDVCDFEWENNRFRPGMPVVTRLADGRWFMVYEGVNMHGGYLPTYYKITDDIENWRPSEREDGVLPRPLDGGSPYCVTMPDGTLVVGAHGTNKVAINTDSLKTDSWMLIDTNIQSAYTRCLVPMENGQLFIVSGGGFSEPDPHKLEISVEDMPIIYGEIDLNKATVTGTTPWGEKEPNFYNSAENVTDGRSDTFFDGLSDGHFVIDLGGEYTVSAIGYQPRTGFGFRVVGGMFYGSMDGENWDKLYTIPANGANDMMNYSTVTEGRYRYIKYTSDGVNACNMGEVKVYSKDIVSVRVNGILRDYNEKTVLNNGVMMLPLRVVAEAMGADVGWLNSEKSAVAVMNDKLLTIPIGSKIYSFNGTEKEAEAEAALIGGTTYVSIDVIEEALGARFTVTDNYVNVNCAR